MKRIVLIIIVLAISITGFSQYNYQQKIVFNPKEDAMSNTLKVKYSRIWTTIGISFVATGIYLGKSRQNPQQIDVPLIIIGVFFTIEGARLHAKK